MHSLAAALTALLLLAAPLAGQARVPTADSSTEAAARWHLGLAADIGQPVGAFKHQVSNAAGLLAHLRLRLDHHGLVSLRLQGGWLNYGHQSQRSCLAATPGCRVEVNVTTANGIFSLGVGPELSIPLGRLRIYGHSLLGMSRFATLSGLGGGLVPDFVAADENYGDSGFAWSGGIGIQLPINRSTAMDFGVAYQGHGRREYLTKGSITDNPDGSLDFDIKRSSANLVAIRLGVTTSLGWGSRKSAP